MERVVLNMYLGCLFNHGHFSSFRYEYSPKWTWREKLYWGRGGRYVFYSWTKQDAVYGISIKYCAKLAEKGNS